jgi:hypothetical protein
MSVDEIHSDRLRFVGLECSGGSENRSVAPSFGSMLRLKTSGTGVIFAQDVLEEVVVAEVLAGFVTSDDHKPI